ncbi:response regulator transcription factor [Streptomyces sp. NPDC048550]|uniref:response regulator n=1 Tax=Streptomyces sp. NPDC048550 TaxID=3155739 RepID=UPI003437773E
MTRSGLHTPLASQQGITVAGEAADGVEALEQALRLRPDVVLMDVRMPRRNGIEVTRLLLAESAGPRTTTTSPPRSARGPAASYSNAYRSARSRRRCASRRRGKRSSSPPHCALRVVA